MATEQEIHTWQRVRFAGPVFLHASAHAESDRVGRLDAGAEGTLLARAADWLFVQDDDGNEGWTRIQSAAPRVHRHFRPRLLFAGLLPLLSVVLAVAVFRPGTQVPASTDARPPLPASAVTPTPRTDAMPTPSRASGPSSKDTVERFTVPRGWPDRRDGTAWYADGVYKLEAREPGRFVAVTDPSSGVLQDGVVTARLLKSGGPQGGGYGLIVADQGPQMHDGLTQGGRFIVLEAGDDGTIGVWQRNQDNWIDIVPWTQSPAVRRGGEANELRVEVRAGELSFMVNDVVVAQVTSTLPAGRVGVFVGGDGNKVVLERFLVGALPQLGQPTPGLTVTAPTTPTPVADSLLAELDATWARGQWANVLELLDRIERVAPSALDFREKRYATHVSAGRELLSAGNTLDAVAQFRRAQAIDPDRVEANAALVALTPTPTPMPVRTLPSSTRPLAQFVDAVMNDVDTYWTQYFSRNGKRHVPAASHWYERRISTPCGPAVPGSAGPFYCTVDSDVYFDTTYMQQTRTESGDFPLAYVVAHEIAHHVQQQLGISKVVAYIVFGQTFSREIELQADCLAGVWSKSAIGRNLAEPSDITQALTLAWKIGDPSWASQRSASAHGRPDDRTGAFLKGFNGTQPTACGLP